MEEETEVEFRLSRGNGSVIDGIPKDVLIVMGTAGAEADTCDPRQTRRPGLLSGAKPFQSSLETPFPLSIWHGSPPSKARTQPVTDRSMETPSGPTIELGSPPPKAAIQLVTDRPGETPSTPSLEARSSVAGGRNAAGNRPAWRNIISIFSGQFSSGCVPPTHRYGAGSGLVHGI